MLRRTSSASPNTQRSIKYIRWLRAFLFAEASWPTVVAALRESMPFLKRIKLHRSLYKRFTTKLELCMNEGHWACIFRQTE